MESSIKKKRVLKTASDAKISPALRIVRETRRFAPNEVQEGEYTLTSEIWGKKNDPKDIILTKYDNGCIRQENVKTGQLILRDAEGRIMKGSILNPSGRGGGTKNMTTILKDAIAQVCEGDPMKRQERIVQKVIEMAEAGDKDMVKLVWEYIDGKAVQRIDHTVDGEAINPMSRAQLDKLDRMFDEGKVHEAVGTYTGENAEKVSAEALGTGDKAREDEGTGA